MTDSLTTYTHSPASGKKARELVILLHGLGANGQDLIGLAPYFAKALPDAVFVSPDAPFPCDMAPYGRQWFSLQEWTPESILRGVQQAAPIRDLDDIAQHAVIGYTYLATGEHWHFSGPQGARSIEVRPRLRSNSGDTCRGAALADQGIIFQPTFLVGEDLQAGRLVQILPQYAGPELDINVVYPSRLHLSHKVRAMVEFLGAAFAQAGRV